MKIATAHKWRMFYVCFALVACGIAAALVLYALRTNIDLFFTPTDLINQQPQAEIRVGGQVKPGSLEYGTDLEVRFILTDYKEEIKVQYKGVLPDLFREEQAVVVRGKLAEKIFYAKQILAKHDQNYTPPELLAKFKE